MTTKPTDLLLPLRLFVPKNKLLGMCFVVLFSITSIQAQTTIYTQPFSGTLAASGWAVNNLAAPWGNATFFGLANLWQTGDTESGMTANVCGGAGLGDPSLFMECTGLASGAAYLSDINTNRRVGSPNISTVGYTNITVEFDFIGDGEGTTDKGYLVYSINGGTGWVVPTGAPTSTNPAMGGGGSINNLKSQICGSGQGRWTHITWTMPVTCEGITNLRVGFVWQSNNNSLGSDPSFAVDDVTITGILTPSPIELISFTAKYNSEKVVNLDWITATEINNDFFTIERSVDAINFSDIIYLDGAGNSSQINAYNRIDANPLAGVSYYRLKQTDFNGDFSYSNIEVVNIAESDFEIINTYSFNDQLEITMHSQRDIQLNLELFSIEGKKVFSSIDKLNDEGKKIIIPTSSFRKGVYIIKASDGNKVISKKIIL